MNLLVQGSVSSERIIVFLTVILQRDPMVKRGADIRCLLLRRMEDWKGEKFTDLVFDVERCSRQHSKPRRKDGEDHSVAVFTRLMLRGQVCSAVRFITDRVSGGGVLACNSPSGIPGKSVADVLQEKHPEPCSSGRDAFLPCDSLQPVLDVDITADYVERVAHRIQGAAGPGGSTAMQWYSNLLRFGAYSARLRDAVAGLARRLANNVVKWEDIRALMANRLIALDKYPGVRPISIGEALRRVLGKVVALVTRADLEEVCGTYQLCSGLRAGVEGAIQAVKELFDLICDAGWGLLLVDAKNSFNSLNRVAALWNARVLWPRCSRCLFNTYRGYAALFLQGSSDYLLSKEGVTQGDPLSMMLYAVAILPLIRSLKNPKRWTQNWYADDSACVATLPSLHAWFSQLLSSGPAFGYLP